MFTITKAGVYQITQSEVLVSGGDNVVLMIDQDANIEINTDEKLKLNIIYRNVQASEVMINSKISNELTLGMVSLQDSALKMVFTCELTKSLASLKLVNAGVCSKVQDFKFFVNHYAPKTFSNIDNYGLVLEGANYQCEIKGTIAKGNKESEVYQNSKILTHGLVEKVRVLPILSMDENDIKAKHACVIGRLAEDQRYYLASRGLSETTILKLVAAGYLSNILGLIDDEVIKTQVSNEIERQVEALCLK